MINYIKQLFCKHYYQSNRLDSKHPTQIYWTIGHKTCKWCRKEKKEIFKH